MISRALPGIWIALWVCSSAARAESLTLEQADTVAERATLFLYITYEDCRLHTAKHESATGFVISRDGLVVTAQHTLVAADGSCEHRIINILGQHNKREIATPGDEPPLKLELVQPLDHKIDLALLQIKGDVPSTLFPVGVCVDPVVRPGDTLYAFGYPWGKSFTPLAITYSGQNAQFSRFNVSGLITFGMSGGPVLDGYGRAVAVITGGLLDKGSHIYALGYIAPIAPVLTSVSRGRLEPQCGAVTTVNFPSVESNDKTGADDAMVCGFGVPKGFIGHYADSGKSTFRIEWDAGARNPATATFVYSQFQINIRRFVIPQAGVGSSNFDEYQNLLPCEAATGWYKHAAPVNDPELGDPGWIDHMLRATRVLTLGDVASVTPERCVEESVWPGAFTSGRARHDPTKITLQDGDKSRVQEKIWANGSDAGRLATLLHFDFTNAEKDTVQAGLAQGKLAIAAAGTPRAMRFIVETDLDERVNGIAATCQAYTNMNFGDFTGMCHAILGRALAKKGMESGECLVPRLTQPGTAEIRY